jgi:hypothetical protein
VRSRVAIVFISSIFEKDAKIIIGFKKCSVPLQIIMLFDSGLNVS